MRTGKIKSLGFVLIGVLVAGGLCAAQLAWAEGENADDLGSWAAPCDTGENTINLICDVLKP